jgi:hypothetical protein
VRRFLEFGLNCSRGLFNLVIEFEHEM